MTTNGITTRETPSERERERACRRTAKERERTNKELWWQKMLTALYSCSNSLSVMLFSVTLFIVYLVCACAWVCVRMCMRARTVFCMFNWVCLSVCVQACSVNGQKWGSKETKREYRKLETWVNCNYFHMYCELAEMIVMMIIIITNSYWVANEPNTIYRTIRSVLSFTIYSCIDGADLICIKIYEHTS